jgi:transposase
LTTLGCPSVVQPSCIAYLQAAQWSPGCGPAASAARLLGVARSRRHRPSARRTGHPLPFDGKRLQDAALVNTEARPRQVYDKLTRHGRALVVVDQPASIGALPVAVARACGHQVAYLPGLAMRRIADLHPDQALAAAFISFL